MEIKKFWKFRFFHVFFLSEYRRELMAEAKNVLMSILKKFWSLQKVACFVKRPICCDTQYPCDKNRRELCRVFPKFLLGTI